jgi:methionyl-tRNA formyltransferase
MPKIVIITGSEAEHRYVSNAICRAHDVAAILVCDPPPRRSATSVLKKSFTRFCDKAAQQLFLRITGASAKRARDVMHTLGPACQTFDKPELITKLGTSKDPALLTKVVALKPDIIAVYGTGIVPDPVLNSAKTIALNMHTGLSPRYRGAACAFWPVVEGNFDQIGATVHECTSQVDGGRMFDRRGAQVQKGDSLHAIFARAVAVGADGYVETLNRIVTGDLTGEVQDLSTGREYRGAMLGIKAEFAARWNLFRFNRQR